MNKQGGRILHEPVGRREMITRTLKAAAAGFAGASVMVGCAGGMKGAGKMQIAGSDWKLDKTPIIGTFLSRPRPFGWFSVLPAEMGHLVLPKDVGSTYGLDEGDSMQMSQYLKDLSKGKPTVLVFMTHYHKPSGRADCNTPVEVAQKVHEQMPGVQVVGVQIYRHGLADDPRVFKRIAEERGVTFPQVATGPSSYIDGVEWLTDSSNPMIVVLDGEQNAVFVTEYYKNENEKGERDIMRVVDMALNGTLPPGEEVGPKILVGGDVIEESPELDENPFLDEKELKPPLMDDPY
jgi:hypothetical protein